jgi:hypothetical protein
MLGRMLREWSLQAHVRFWGLELQESFPARKGCLDGLLTAPLAADAQQAATHALGRVCR